MEVTWFEPKTFGAEGVDATSRLPVPEIAKTFKEIDFCQILSSSQLNLLKHDFYQRRF